MQHIQAKDLAVALGDYATIDEGASLYEAVTALRLKREQFDPLRPRHRAILVLDKANHVVGKIGYRELVRALEPGYGEIDLSEAAPFTASFIRSQLEKYALWKYPLDDLCRKAARFRVRDFMHLPAEHEYIDEEATLDQLVHQFIMTGASSLLLRRGAAVTGILRLSDLAEKIADMVLACDL